jgi:phage shock protein PspC (stress-responsive transcriptional regulator)
MSEHDVIGNASEPGEKAEPEKLRRSASNRKVAGVAGGIGERFDIDANVVRVVFVVLTLAVGLGAAIYLALWALVPLNGAQDGTTTVGAEGGHRWSLRGLVLLAGALCLGLIVLSVARNGPHVGRAIGLFWLIFLVVLAVVSLQRPGGFGFVRFLLGLLVVIVSLVVLVAGGVLAYVAASGVPLTGGVGQRIYQPSSAAEVQTQYRLAIGTMFVDLRGVRFREQSLSIVATVGIGQLMVAVPPGVQVNLNAQSGTSNITYPDGSGSFYLPSRSKNSTAHLNLTVRVGIGRVELLREGSAIPLTTFPAAPKLP